MIIELGYKNIKYQENTIANTYASRQQDSDIFGRLSKHIIELIVTLKPA